jgi:hypothetical protein
MGLSVASLRPISGLSYVQQKPMNYTVDNQSDVSGAFVESMENASPAKVDAAPPVRYPTAQVSSIDSAEQVTRNQQVNRAYNNIASRYSGTVTGYGQDRAARAYGTVGQALDLFA